MQSTVGVRSFLSIAIPLTIGVVIQATRPDFSGRWTLSPQETTQSGGGRGDASGNATGGGGGGGGGTGLGRPANELSIQQDDSMLLLAARRESITDTIRYRFDGKAVTNLMPVGRGETVHTTNSSRWSRSRLETTIVRKVGSRSIRYRELMYFTADSGLVIETDVVGMLGGRRAVYREAG